MRCNWYRIDYFGAVPIARRTLLVALSGVTAFVVTVVALAPFVNSQSTSISTGDRFWSISTIGAGVLAVVAVGTAAMMARCRLRTAAMTVFGGLLLELPGLYDHNFEALSPVGAGVAVGAVTVAAAPRVRAASVAGNDCCRACLGFTSSTKTLFLGGTRTTSPTTPTSFNHQCWGQHCSRSLWPPPGVAAFWFHDFDKDHPKERMAVRPVTIAAVLTLFGVAANWWFEITTVTAAVPLLLVALVITVICARVLGDGSRILLMCTAAVATLAAVSANRPATEAMEWSKTPASTAVVIGLVIVAAAALGAIAPSRVVGYGLLLTVTVAGIVSYATSPSPKIGDVLTISDLLVAFTAAVVTYAIASAMYREPPRTGASRALVGLGVIFGPTALALLVYPQFDYGWTAYTPLDENKPFNGITTVGPVRNLDRHSDTRRRGVDHRGRLRLRESPIGADQSIRSSADQSIRSIDARRWNTLSDPGATSSIAAYSASVK